MDSNTNMSLISRLNRFKVTKFTPDISHLSSNEKQAVGKLYELATYIDHIYLRQSWDGNEALLKKLEEDTSGTGKLKLELFHLFKGPWDQISGKEPFIENIPSFPPTANFYPLGLTKEDFAKWTSTLCYLEKKEANSFYTVIRKNSDDGSLYSRPYSEEYADLLNPASKLLKEAAALVDDKSLSTFLNERADSFLNQDYLKSELAWLQISKESNLEVTCGPYEVYTDELLSLKSSFELYVHARDMESSKKLDQYTSALSFVEKNLPIPDNYKNKELKATPIVVVNQLFSAGDVSVPMTAAYNLPNDEAAIVKGGSKLVIIKNVQEGKFHNVLEPIAKLVLDPTQSKYVQFDAFFTHILLHEVAHSNGPHFTCNPDIPQQPVRNLMQEFHSALEEAKADITGLFAAELLIQNNKLDGISIESFWVTYLVSAFRSIRFGIHEAHGRGQVIQLNFLLDEGGFAVENGLFKVNFDLISQAVSKLTTKIMILQGDGIKSEVEKYFTKYANIRPDTAHALASLADVPIDIYPIYSNYK